jgi:hypothetical protein
VGVTYNTYNILNTTNCVNSSLVINGVPDSICVAGYTYYSFQVANLPLPRNAIRQVELRIYFETTMPSNFPIQYRSGFSPNSTDSIIEPWNAVTISGSSVTISVDSPTRVCIETAFDIEFFVEVANYLDASDFVISLSFPDSVKVLSYPQLSSMTMAVNGSTLTYSGNFAADYSNFYSHFFLICVDFQVQAHPQLLDSQGIPNSNLDTGVSVSAKIEYAVFWDSNVQRGTVDLFLDSVCPIVQDVLQRRFSPGGSDTAISVGDCNLRIWICSNASRSVLCH